MTCPFGHGSSLRQTQQLAQALAERNGEPAGAQGSGDVVAQISHVQVPPSSASPPSASASVSPPVTRPGSGNLFSPPLGSNGGRSKLPLSLWTGGLRTSLGVENAHPISVWMKEMQARGGLKGVDIEKVRQPAHSDSLHVKRASKQCAH